MNEIIKDATDGGVRVVEIGAPEGATLVRYAQIVDGVVTQVVESHVDPDGVGPEWVACGNAGPGWTYDGITFYEPPMPPTPVDPCEWLIDIGPFFDRFGAQKIPVLADTNAIVRAIVTDCTSRKWIDLKRADVGLAIDTLINLGHAVDKAAILDLPVIPAENLALRKLYFS